MTKPTHRAVRAVLTRLCQEAAFAPTSSDESPVARPITDGFYMIYGWKYGEARDRASPDPLMVGYARCDGDAGAAEAKLRECAAELGRRYHVVWHAPGGGPPPIPDVARLEVVGPWDSLEALRPGLLANNLPSPTIAGAVSHCESASEALESLSAQGLLPLSFGFDGSRSFLVACGCDGGWVEGPSDRPITIDPDDPSLSAEDVRRFQRFYNSMPYGPRKLSVDGVMGPETRAAVERHERAQGGPSRVVCPRCLGTLAAVGDMPPSCAAVAAMASDLPRFAEAEHHARDLAVALEAWRGPSPAPSAVRWSFTFATIAPGATMFGAREFALSVAGEIIRDVEDRVREGGTVGALMLPDGLEILHAEHSTLAAAAADGVVVREEFMNRRASCVRLASRVTAGDLPSPYLPLLRIARLGFAVREVSEGAVVLAARLPGPLVDAPAAGPVTPPAR